MDQKDQRDPWNWWKKPEHRTRVPIPELEKSLFLEIREVHTKCNSFIWDLDSAAPGCCTSCMVQTKGGIPKPLKVRDSEKAQVFFYKLRDGRIYGTTQGIWNMN